MLDDEPRPKGVVFSIPNRSLMNAARCLCAHDEPSTINGGAARLALQTRNIVLRILPGEAETQKKFFRGTIFHFEGVARLALQRRSATSDREAARNGPTLAATPFPSFSGDAIRRGYTCAPQRR